MLDGPGPNLGGEVEDSEGQAGEAAQMYFVGG